MNKIVIIERIFPLYRKAVLDLVYKKHPFKFLHSIEKKSGIRQTNANYSDLIQKWNYNNKESGVFLFCLRKIFRIKPKVIVHEFSAGILSILFILAYCKMFHRNLIFWGHMYNRQKGFDPNKSISDKYRRWLWQKADSLITYSNSDKELLITHNIPEEKIFVAYNTIDTNEYLQIRNNLEKIGKANIKKRLDFTHEFNLVFIGRLLKDKKPGLLLDVLTGLKKNGIESVAVHYIGEGEMLSQLKKQSSALNHSNDVFFHGAIYDKKNTGEILFASDLMIMPECVGLSVNHSFCFNCPVATFSGRNSSIAHGPEVEYIINNKTGFLIDDDSVESLVRSTMTYLNSTDIQSKMKNEIRYLIENVCSVEKMSEGIINAIEHNLY